MKSVAAGRIAVWEGGSLWVFNVPGDGDGPSRRKMHAHHAFQLTFSLGGTFSLRLEDRVISNPFGMVSPDQTHSFEAKGLIAHLFVEPESPAGRLLLRQTNRQPHLPDNLDDAFEAAEMIRSAFECPVDPLGALRDVGLYLCDRIAGCSRMVELDRRVRQMIRWATENLDRTVGISEAASLTGLSPSRASHLFVEQTGLPFRHYVLWLRLVRAVQTYSMGANLTEAAHEAGFSDSAHLSRTFNRMFGLPAASLTLS